MPCSFITVVCRLCRKLQNDVCQCFWDVIHALYSVARNGLWEDPAEATTGFIFARFVVAAEAQGLTRTAASYLTWRYCYLLCSIVFMLFWVAASFKDWAPDKEQYDALLDRLPAGLRRDRFEGIADAMAWWDTIVALFWCVSFVLLIVATACASPSCAINRANLSQRLVWMSWSTRVLVPFAILLVFPIRSLVDWDGLSKDTCAVTVNSALGTDGFDTSAAIAGLRQQGFLGPNVEGLPTNFATSSDEALKAIQSWCVAIGDDWYEVFFVQTLPCVYELQNSCRQSPPCVSATDVALLDTCLRNCLALVPNVGQCSGISSGLYTVESVLSSTAAWGTSGASTATTKGLGMVALSNQQATVIQLGERAELMVPMAEYIVGVFIAIRTGALLLTAALSVLGGLAEALLNVKALFPESQQVSWLLVLTVAEAVPVYAALGSMLLQLLGDHVFAITTVLTVAYVSLSGITGMRILRLRSGALERWKLYKKIWMEYALRTVLLIGMVLTLVLFVRDRAPWLRNSMNALQPVVLLIQSLVDYLPRKSLLAIAGTDAALSATLQSDIWRQGWSPDDAQRNEVTLHELSSLILPKLAVRARVADDGF
mmetsp:Transcript_95894/g.190078  ORF Transcript_95894/g.190078 Transcript_95894/m.190078 type:complete len:599 (-) Transcript_95894:314-2110(-)